MRKLDCAVLAMRYEVGDEFAIELATDLYDRLFRQSQPLPRALQLALREALDGDEVQAPALSVATPVLFGRLAPRQSAGGRRGLSKRLHRARMPTLLLWGERDPLSPPA